MASREQDSTVENRASKGQSTDLRAKGPGGLTVPIILYLCKEKAPVTIIGLFSRVSGSLSKLHAPY